MLFIFLSHVFIILETKFLSANILIALKLMSEFVKGKKTYFSYEVFTERMILLKDLKFCWIQI